MTNLETYAQEVRSGLLTGQQTKQQWKQERGEVLEAFDKAVPKKPFNYSLWLFQVPTFVIAVALLIWALTYKDTPANETVKRNLKNPIKVATLVKENIIEWAFAKGLAIEFDCREVLHLKAGGRAGVYCTYKRAREFNENEVVHEERQLTTMTKL